MAFPSPVVASAPGKVFPIGGYTVLDRPNVSYVVGVDKRVFAKVAPRQDSVVILDAPQFKTRVTGSWANGRLMFEPPLAEEIAKKTAFVRAAADTALRWLSCHGADLTGFELTTIADPAFGAGTSQKSGLGSSAAVTAAVVGALFAAFGHDPATTENRDFMHRIAQYAHFRAQGKVGSGFDVAAAVYGSVKYVRFSPSLVTSVPENAGDEVLMLLLDTPWDCLTHPIALPKGWSLAFGNFPGASTSSVSVSKLWAEWKTKNPEEFRKKVAAIDLQSARAINALQNLSTNGSTPELLAEFRDAFDKGRVLLAQATHAAGIMFESDASRALIEESMKNGALVAKLPGAGGEDGIAAFCVSDVDRKRLEAFWAGYAGKKVEPVALRHSNHGIRVESDSAFATVKRAAGV